MNPGPLGVAKHNYPEGKRVDDAPNQSKGKLRRIRVDPLKMQNCRKRMQPWGFEPWSSRCQRAGLTSRN